MRFVFFLCFVGFSIGLSAKNITRGVRLEFQNNCVSLSNENKNIIIDEYLKIGEGDWLYFTTVSVKEISSNRLLAFKNAKLRNRLIGSFLQKNGIDQNDLKYKYSSYEHIWVNKPMTLNSSVNLDNQSDGENEQSKSFRNIDGASFYLNSGNIIEFKSMNFEGHSTDMISVTIKEFTSKSDFVKYGVTAQGDKGMLETQGMYHIEAKCNGQKITLRRNSNYALKIEGGKSDKEFYSFYGSEKNGQLTWSKNAKEKFYSSTSSVSNNQEEIVEYMDEEEGFLDGVYVSETESEGSYLIGKFSNLGWINCDRFYDEEETITMKLKIGNGIADKPYAVYIDFHDINSVLPVYTVTNGTYQTPKIPKDSKVTVFAYKKGENPFPESGSFNQKSATTI